MLGQIKTLTGLELCNLFGLNVFRFTKDKKARRKAMLLTFSWLLVIGILVFYVGGLSYGLILLGAGDVIPAYLIAISSLIIFFFDVFKAGSVIFRKNGYDILCSLPLSQTAVVVSRFLRMYVEDLALTLTVLLPGLAVYAWFTGPEAGFYLISILTALLVPVAPITAATLIGALVTAAASRMKHKSLVEAGLSTLIVLAVLGGSSQLTGIEGTISPELLKELSAAISGILEKLYPPAVWLGAAIVTEDLLVCLVCMALFIAMFAVVIAIVSANFHAICRRLFATSAKHDYQMEPLRQNSVLTSLYKRELKRYFASGIYVSNTIIGPIMGTVFSAALLFVDMGQVTQVLPASFDIPGLVPFLMAGIFCLMTATSVSISMEGKNWWIVKSLPLSTKTILDAKILMNLSLMMPFYLVSEVLLVLALKPNFINLIWMLLIPAVIMLFSCVYGITINLHFPVLNWESEVSVVKQSASSLLGGMGGFLLAILCAIPTALIPAQYSDWLKLATCAILLGITAMLYRRNNRFDLKQI